MTPGVIVKSELQDLGGGKRTQLELKFTRIYIEGHGSLEIKRSELVRDVCQFLMALTGEDAKVRDQFLKAPDQEVLPGRFPVIEKPARPSEPVKPLKQGVLGV